MHEITKWCRILDFKSLALKRGLLMDNRSLFPNKVNNPCSRRHTGVLLRDSYFSTLSRLHARFAFLTFYLLTSFASANIGWHAWSAFSVFFLQYTLPVFLPSVHLRQKRVKTTLSTLSTYYYLLMTSQPWNSEPEQELDSRYPQWVLAQHMFAKYRFDFQLYSLRSRTRCIRKS